jgi:pimeloyl-ACP methyl ester carboxylesterase
VDGLPAESLRERMRSGHPDWSAAAIEATAANLRERPDGTVERRLSIPNHLRILRSMWDDPPWPDLAKVTVPVLLMPAIPADPLAGRNTNAKREAVQRTLAALPRARVREYVDADHDLHAQQPEAVAADLLALAGETARREHRSEERARSGPDRANAGEEPS